MYVNTASFRNKSLKLLADLCEGWLSIQTVMHPRRDLLYLGIFNKGTATIYWNQSTEILRKHPLHGRVFLFSYFSAMSFFSFLKLGNETIYGARKQRISIDRF